MQFGRSAEREKRELHYVLELITRFCTIGFIILNRKSTQICIGFGLGPMNLKNLY